VWYFLRQGRKSFSLSRLSNWFQPVNILQFPLRKFDQGRAEGIPSVPNQSQTLREHFSEISQQEFEMMVWRKTWFRTEFWWVGYTAFIFEASILSSTTEAFISEKLLKTDTDTHLLYSDNCPHRSTSQITQWLKPYGEKVLVQLLYQYNIDPALYIRVFCNVTLCLQARSYQRFEGS